MSDNEQKTQVAFIVSGIVIAEFLCACFVSASLFHETEPKLNDNETVAEEVEEENNNIYYKEIKSIIDDINSAEEDFKKVVTNKNVKISLKDEAFYYFYKKLEKTQKKILDTNLGYQYIYNNLNSTSKNDIKLTKKGYKYYLNNPSTQIFYYDISCKFDVKINFEYLEWTYSRYLSDSYKQFINLKWQESEDSCSQDTWDIYTQKWGKIWSNYLNKYPNNYFSDEISAYVRDELGYSDIYEQDEYQNDETYVNEEIESKTENYEVRQQIDQRLKMIENGDDMPSVSDYETPDDIVKRLRSNNN